uniref:KASH domain-containing protein n=1 Tax=Heliothis virescens TaxID=7102 RepID=A0A2A4IV22_HELVI
MEGTISDNQSVGIRDVMVEANTVDDGSKIAQVQDDTHLETLEDTPMLIDRLIDDIKTGNVQSSTEVVNSNEKSISIKLPSVQELIDTDINEEPVHLAEPIILHSQVETEYSTVEDNKDNKNSVVCETFKPLTMETLNPIEEQTLEVSVQVEQDIVGKLVPHQEIQPIVLEGLKENNEHIAEITDVGSHELIGESSQPIIFETVTYLEDDVKKSALQASEKDRVQLEKSQDIIPILIASISESSNTDKATIDTEMVVPQITPAVVTESTIDERNNSMLELTKDAISIGETSESIVLDSVTAIEMNQHAFATKCDELLTEEIMSVNKNLPPILLESITPIEDKSVEFAYPNIEINPTREINVSQKDEVILSESVMCDAFAEENKDETKYLGENDQSQMELIRKDIKNVAEEILENDAPNEIKTYMPMILEDLAPIQDVQPVNATVQITNDNKIEKRVPTQIEEVLLEQLEENEKIAVKSLEDKVGVIAVQESVLQVIEQASPIEETVASLEALGSNITYQTPEEANNKSMLSENLCPLILESLTPIEDNKCVPITAQPKQNMENQPTYLESVNDNETESITSKISFYEKNLASEIIQPVILENIEPLIQNEQKAFTKELESNNSDTEMFAPSYENELMVLEQIEEIIQDAVKTIENEKYAKNIDNQPAANEQDYISDELRSCIQEESVKAFTNEVINEDIIFEKLSEDDKNLEPQTHNVSKPVEHTTCAEANHSINIFQPLILEDTTITQSDIKGEIVKEVATEVDTEGSTNIKESVDEIIEPPTVINTDSTTLNTDGTHDDLKSTENVESTVDTSMKAIDIVKIDDMLEKNDDHTIRSRTEYENDDAMSHSFVKRTEQGALINHIDEFISEEVSEVVGEISVLTNSQELKDTIELAKGLKESIEFVPSEESVELTNVKIEQGKLAEKLQDALSILLDKTLEHAEEIVPKVNPNALQKVSEIITHLQEDLEKAIVFGMPDVLNAAEIVEIPEEEGNSMKQLEVLLQEVTDKINIPTVRDVEETEALKDVLDEVQTVIIKLKRDYDGAANDTLNETLEDLECSVRSVQLQINEDSPPELLQEACATLQLLVNNMTETQDVSAQVAETVSVEVKTENILEKCSTDTDETVKLLEEASKANVKDERLSGIVSSLNILKDTIKFLRLSFVGNADVLIEKGVDVVQNLDQLEEKVFTLEKDLAEVNLSTEVRDHILTAIHSVYGSISNMRGTISSIQKRYMFENYGKPSETILRSIKNVSGILEIDDSDKQSWKAFSKSLRKVLNHFEDIKFYINLDKTARLPSDAAFTKIILEELKSNICEIVIPRASVLGPDTTTKVNDLLECLNKYLADIETKSTVEVKEKIPVFLEISSKIYEVTDFIKQKVIEKSKEIKAELLEKEPSEEQAKHSDELLSEQVVPVQQKDDVYESVQELEKTTTEGEETTLDTPSSSQKEVKSVEKKQKARKKVFIQEPDTKAEVEEVASEFVDEITSLAVAAVQNLIEFAGLQKDELLTEATSQSVEVETEQQEAELIENDKITGEGAISSTEDLKVEDVEQELKREEPTEKLEDVVQDTPAKEDEQVASTSVESDIKKDLQISDETEEKSKELIGQQDVPQEEELRPQAELEKEVHPEQSVEKLGIDSQESPTAEVAKESEMEAASELPEEKTDKKEISDENVEQDKAQMEPKQELDESAPQQKMQERQSEEKLGTKGSATQSSQKPEQDQQDVEEERKDSEEKETSDEAQEAAEEKQQTENKLSQENVEYLQEKSEETGKEAEPSVVKEPEKESQQESITGKQQDVEELKTEQKEDLEKTHKEQATQEGQSVQKDVETTLEQDDSVSKDKGAQRAQLQEDDKRHDELVTQEDTEVQKDVEESQLEEKDGSSKKESVVEEPSGELVAEKTKSEEKTDEPKQIDVEAKLGAGVSEKTPESTDKSQKVEVSIQQETGKEQADTDVTEQEIEQSEITGAQDEPLQEDTKKLEKDQIEKEDIESTREPTKQEKEEAGKKKISTEEKAEKQQEQQDEPETHKKELDEEDKALKKEPQRRDSQKSDVKELGQEDATSEPVKKERSETEILEKEDLKAEEQTKQQEQTRAEENKIKPVEGKLAKEQEDVKDLEKERVKAENLAEEQAEKVSEKQTASEELEKQSLEIEQKQTIAEKQEKEKKESELLAKQQAETGKLDMEQKETELLAQKQVEAEEIEKERVNTEQLVKQTEELKLLEESADAKLTTKKEEDEKLSKEQEVTEKLKQEPLESEEISKDQIESEKTQQDVEKLAQEKVEADTITETEAEALGKERVKSEMLAKEQEETDRLEKKCIEAEKHAEKQAKDQVLAKEQAEAEQHEQELIETENLAKEKAEMDKFAKEQAEAEKLEKDRLEAEKLEKERQEAERLEKERLEAERLEKERLEAEKIEKDRVKAEKLAKKQAKAEKLAKEQAEAERLEKERADAEKLEKERLEAEKLEKEQAEAERMEKERLEAEKLEKEQLEAEKLEKEQLEAEKLEKERLEAEKLEKERIEAEKRAQKQAEAEKLEKERIEAEKLEKERIEAEKLEKDRVEAEKLAKERLQAEKLEKERLEAEKLEKKQTEAKKLKGQQVDAEEPEKGGVEKKRPSKKKKKESESNLGVDKKGKDDVAKIQATNGEKLEQDHLKIEKVDTKHAETEKLQEDVVTSKDTEKVSKATEKKKKEGLEKRKMSQSKKEEVEKNGTKTESDKPEKLSLGEELPKVEEGKSKSDKAVTDDKLKAEADKREKEAKAKELENEKLKAEKERQEEERRKKEKDAEKREEKKKLSEKKRKQEEKLKLEQEEKALKEKEAAEKKKKDDERLKEKERLDAIERENKLKQEEVEKQEREKIRMERLEKEKQEEKVREEEEKARLEKKRIAKKKREEEEERMKLETEALEKARKDAAKKRKEEEKARFIKEQEEIDKREQEIRENERRLRKEKRREIEEGLFDDKQKPTSTSELESLDSKPRRTTNGDMTTHAADVEDHYIKEYHYEPTRQRSDERTKFVDHNHRDYTMEFSRPSGYRERTFEHEKFSERESLGRSGTIYKAKTIILDSQLRSSAPPQAVSSDSERRSERYDRTDSDRRVERHRSKALSEARSLVSEKRSGLSRDLKRKPVFSTYLTDRTAVEGSRVKLTCSVLSSSDPKITWYKNGVLLNDKLKYRTKFIDGLITLEVLNAVVSDSAEYTCTVENENGSVNTVANLKVYPSFEASPIPPTFTRSIRDTYHLAENELVLECRIRGQPLPTITWLKDDKPIATSERYQAYYLADGVCRLSISSPTPEDSGKYTCKAENSVWTDQITHIVSFTGKESRLSPNLATRERSHFNRQALESRRPHFTNVLSDYKVVKGGTIGLQVEIRGCPTRVEWLREGRSVTEIYRNARTFVEQGLYTLALSDVTEKESGLYTCRAWSTHGNVDMNAAITVVPPTELEGKPAIIAGRPDKDILISVGEDVNISFRVQGEPKPKVVFMKGIRDITTSQRVCKMTSDDYVKFTLKRSVVSDAGTYCILARNAYGCDRAFVTVVVRQRASSENLISDWTYPLDDSALSISERKYKSVPDRIPGEPSVVDGGNNWVSLAWPKADPRDTAPVLAYKIESWLLGKEGGARWVELGITPLNSFDAFNLKQGEEYHFRVTPRNRYGWGEAVQTSTPVGIGLAGDRPEFVEILPGQLKVLAGETANLSCSVKGKPVPEIVWMKNGHEIEEESRMTTLYNGQDCSLTIKDICIEDEARYSCEASNVHGRASTYARLAVVTDRLIWEADAKLKRERSQDAEGDYPPQFTMRLRDRRVQATYPVRLTCQVVGGPPPTLTWFKDGEHLVLDSRRSVYQDEHFHTLEIAPTTLEDGGVYEAMARNSSGAVSCRCSLVVDKGIRAYVAPEFCCGLEPLYRLREGDELRISAVVEAYPSVGVTWYRDGVRLRPSRRAIMTLDRDGQIELALAFVTCRDAGVYTCTASNEVGRASTSGKVEVVAGAQSREKRTPPVVINAPDERYSKEPMFVRKPRSSEAREGDTVIIACEVIGDPKPDVYWLRDFLKPDYYRDATHFKRVGDGPEYRFEIPHAKLDYTGAYSVVARNVHGEAKAIISLQIKAKDPSADDTHNIRYGRVEVIPRFERELTDLLSYDGDAVEFECHVTGNPEPDIRWFHYNELIRDCEDFESTFDDGAARLKIKQVTAEDEGTYSCEASNNLGKATSSACLVVYPPGEPNTLSQRLRRPPALLSAASTPRSTPRSTPARSVSRTPGPDTRRLCSPSRQMAPSFYTYPFNKVVEEGETVTFKCAVKGQPSPWATWDKDGIIITPSARFTIKEKDELLRILEIEQVTIEDVGVYRITIENEFGRAEASARLEVITQKGKFYAGVRAYSASPRKSLTYRRYPSVPRQD